MAAQIIGYPPSIVNHCPECGSTNIEAQTVWHSDGLLNCKDCGLQCHIIEGEHSHEEI